MSITSLVASGRRMINATLIDRCLPLAHVVAPDGEGGTVSTWEPRGDPSNPMHCAFTALIEGDERGRVLREAGGQMDSAARGALMIPIEESLVEGEYIVDVATGRSWIILGETTPPSARATVRRLLIRED